MAALPDFTTYGVLPPGEYPITLEELENSYLVFGPPAPNLPSSWDVAWRRQLVANLRIMVGQLRRIGISEIFIDGSFVEDKDHPNDIDGYFACDPRYFAQGHLEHDLNLIDPAKCWTWAPASRTYSRGSSKFQLPMWHTYRVELYPHFTGLIAGHDEFGQPLEFPAFFRKCRRNNRPKGILKIVN